MFKGRGERRADGRETTGWQEPKPKRMAHINKLLFETSPPAPPPLKRVWSSPLREGGDDPETLGQRVREEGRYRAEHQYNIAFFSIKRMVQKYSSFSFFVSNHQTRERGSFFWSKIKTFQKLIFFSFFLKNPTHPSQPLQPRVVSIWKCLCENID